MAGLEDAGSQLRASGACDAWFGACDDITRRVAGGVNGPLFTRLLEATGYVDVECVELFRTGSASCRELVAHRPLAVASAKPLAAMSYRR